MVVLCSSFFSYLTYLFLLSLFTFCGSLCLPPGCSALSSLLPHLLSYQNFHIIPFHSHKNVDFSLSSDTLSPLCSLFFSKPLPNALLLCPRIYSQLQTSFPLNLLTHIRDVCILRLISFSSLSTNRNRDELSYSLLLQFHTQVRFSELEGSFLTIWASADWATKSRSVSWDMRNVGLCVLLLLRYVLNRWYRNT